LGDWQQHCNWTGHSSLTGDARMRLECKDIPKAARALVIQHCRITGSERGHAAVHHQGRSSTTKWAGRTLDVIITDIWSNPGGCISYL
jgi:hypothetical protein